MALGRRCGLCGISWPDKLIYTKCPQCDETTTRFSNLTPIDDDEAAHISFDAYYARRCEARGYGVDGPLPDD
jgi:formate dehydrogenase maturation protein FdhE